MRPLSRYVSILSPRSIGETTQLGSRFDKSKGRWVRNMVDGFKRNRKGGIDYAEVDKMTKGGLPDAKIRPKLKMELKNLKENDTLIFVDKTNPARRIEYKFGEPPSVIDTRKAPSQ